MLEDASERAPPEFPGVPLSTVIEAKYLYYVCHRCHLPFWGGNKDCGAFAAGEPDTEPSLLVCESCAASDFACPIHRHDFVVYRCQQCCNPATHLSLGHIRLCDRCVAAKSRDIVPHRHGGERCGCGADVRRPHGGISSDCLLRLKKGNRGCGEKYLGPRTDTISALEYVLLSPQEPHC